MRFLLKVLSQSVLLVGSAAASAWSVRVGCADYWFRQVNVSSTNKAIAILPGRAVFQLQLALLESDDNVLGARAALRRAVDLNPSDARSWIELGLRYEADADTVNAEQCLLRAAEVDKQYLPRWTLANYYFRRNDNARFWVWAKESAGMVYGDPLPLFRLCGRVAEDGTLIDRLMIKQPDIQVEYLDYLLSLNRLDLIRQPIRYLLDGNRPSYLPILLNACNRLLEKSAPEALAVWNGLADAHRIPFGHLWLAGGTVLTNGNFATSPTSQGFDWRLAPIEGVTATTEENPSGLRITFSGVQPESCEPLVQFAPVQGNMEYKLRFRYRTSSIPGGAGLAWRITDMNGVILRAASMSSETEAQTEVAFFTPAGCRFVRLLLAYQRTPGATRIDGFVVLRNAELKPVPQPAKFP